MKFVKVLLYIFGGALLGSMTGCDFVPLHFKPQERVIGGLLIGGLLGLAYGSYRKFE